MAELEMRMTILINSLAVRAARRRRKIDVHPALKLAIMGFRSGLPAMEKGPKLIFPEPRPSLQKRYIIRLRLRHHQLRPDDETG
jgi:hypothetical protein